MKTIARALALLVLASSGPFAARCAPAATEPFDFDRLVNRACELASRPYVARPVSIPVWLRKLSYDQYRDIRFQPAQAWWNREALPFRLQFFHPGFLFARTVGVNEVQGGRTRPIPFSRDYFDYGHLAVGELPPAMGFAGFKILYPLNKSDDELGAFEGASYFRMLCRSAVYGLSARGLAIDTGERTAEEFPDFRQFWISKPEPGGRKLVVCALLDSPSVAGAYRFEIAPGADSVVRARQVLFCRRNPRVLGIAPLTSMFWHGKNTNRQWDDFRPEVHDSDGLMLHTGRGEWLWRPLANPQAQRVGTFVDENPRGFGLAQRERRFEAYQDLEANYQRRPSAWVEPLGDWGRGSVRLIELYAPDETNDNIVAFWVPEELPPVGTPIRHEYALHWFLDQVHPPAGYAISTRHGRSRTQEPELERFVVDFAGEALASMGQGEPLETVVTVGAGAALAHPPTIQKNPNDGSWRAAFALRPDGSGRQVELRCFLRRGRDVLGETWTYLWNPRDP